MSVPDGVKKPSDRKTKAEAKYKPGDLFEFDAGDETHTLKDPTDAITPGFLRKYRNAAGPDLTYSALELLATEAQLDALDNMSWAENTATLKRFDAYVGGFFGASLGE